MINRYYKWDARQTPLPNSYVDIVITSPPYNGNIPYKTYNDNIPRMDYELLIYRFMWEMHRVLKPDGRLCINIANTGRNPYYANNALISKFALYTNFKMRGEIIWVKNHNVLGTGWGSYKSPSCPSLRDRHEYILVFHKELAKKQIKGTREITKDEFIHSTSSIWELPTARKTGKDDFPAKMPEEMVERLIKLYSYQEELVFDPFCGSGTVCKVAQRLGNNWIGSDIDLSYVES